MKRYENGVLVDMTPEEIAAHEADQAGYVPVEQPLFLCQVAAARLAINGFDITGIERSQGIGFAMMADENTAWLFFSEPQPDTTYIVTPADGVTKYGDYIEVACPGAASIALIVQKVQ